MMKFSTPQKGNLALYCVLLALVISAMLALRNCRGGEVVVTPAPAQKSGGDTLDIAIEYSPTSYYSYDDTLGGFDYDLLRIIAHRMGRPAKFHPVVTLSKALDDLNSGRYDMLAAQFPQTTDNQKRFLFTDEVYLDRQVLVQRVVDGKSKVKTQLDLAGKILWVVKDSPMRDRIVALGREIGDTIGVMADSQYGPEQLFLRVASGEIDYAVINARIAETLQQRLAKKGEKNVVDISCPVSFHQLQSWVLKMGNDTLQKQLNEQLRAVKQEEIYKKLSSRYL